MKKLTVILLFTFHFSLFTATQAQKPYIPTMEDYCQQFAQGKDWTVSCVAGLQVCDSLTVDALLLQVEGDGQWESLLAQFHILPQQLYDPEENQLRMGWARTWRRNLKRDAFSVTPGEHAVLTFFSPATASVLLLFPGNSTDEQRLLGFFLAKYANQNPLQVMRLEVLYDPDAREFDRVWSEPILSWSTRMQIYNIPQQKKTTIKRMIR